MAKAREDEVVDYAEDSYHSIRSESCMESSPVIEGCDEFRKSVDCPITESTDCPITDNTQASDSLRSSSAESIYMASDRNDGDTACHYVQKRVENLSVIGEDAKATEQARLDAEAVEDYTPLVNDLKVDKLLNPTRLKFQKEVKEFIRKAYCNTIKATKREGPIRLRWKSALLDIAVLNIAYQRGYNVLSGVYKSSEDQPSIKNIIRTSEYPSEDGLRRVVAGSASKSAFKESPSKLTTFSTTESNEKESPNERLAHVKIGSAGKGSQMETLPSRSEIAAGLSPVGKIPSPVLGSSDPYAVLKSRIEDETMVGSLDMERIAPFEAREDELKIRLSIIIDLVTAILIIISYNTTEEEEISLAKSTSSDEAIRSSHKLSTELVFAEKLLEFEKSATILLHKCLASANLAYSYNIFSDPNAKFQLDDLCKENLDLKLDIQNLLVDYTNEMTNFQVRNDNGITAQQYVRNLLHKTSLLVKALNVEFVDFLSIYVGAKNEASKPLITV